MNTSASAKTCPKCGQPIPPEAPQGLCPKCLLREVSIPTETAKGPPSHADVPNLDELKAAFPQLEILELIGQGGMGFVYKARQPKLDRFVALKILPQSLAKDPNFTERFTREGRVLAKLNHPNVVTVYDFGQANGFFYLLMEFVNGVNLRQAMQAGRFTPAQALALIPEICEALQYAHMHAILHRDIKPENILLDANGRVKIADFGIAKLLSEVRPEGNLTGSGAAVGTPNYMAPEQIETPSEVDHRADIYSLGVVLYEMLTGELPLGKFPPPSEKTALNPRVDAVVLRALEKQREKRYQTAREVKTGVQGIAAPPELPNEKIFAGRYWLMLGILAAIAVAMLAVFRSGSVKFPRPTVQIKTITLKGYDRYAWGWQQPKRNLFKISASCSLLPQERLRTWLRVPDGTIHESTTHEIVYNTLGEKRTSYLFDWVLPDTMEVPQLDVAGAQLQNWEGKHISLTAGQPVVLFRATNSFGGQYWASMEYVIETPPTNAADLVASVRVIESGLSTNYGSEIVNLSIKLDAAVPAAHVLECSAFSLAGLPEYSRLSFARKEMYRNLGCDWQFPATFTTEQHQDAVRQVRNAAYIMLSGGRTNVFSVTNKAGDVLRGYLALVPPK